jgi:hypothetical protein
MCLLYTLKRKVDVHNTTHSALAWKKVHTLLLCPNKMDS